MATTAVQLDPRVQTYIDGVLSGEIIACRAVRQAVERHVRDLETCEDRCLWFDAEEGQLAIEFIELLRHSKGEWAGRALKLQPWQCFIVAVIFGWKKTDGTRRFNTAFISTARKSGKSTLGAAIGHKLFVADGEPGAEVYTAATKRDQAKIVHEEARRMVKSSPCLSSTVRILRDVLAIEATDSKYQPLGADADSTDGLNLSGAIIDEVHAHKTRDLWDVLETATASRRSPLIVAITTAGSAGDEESIYAELHGYTMKVLSGTVVDDSWFGIVYTLDDGDDWTDEAVWIKANPNLGESVKLDDLRRKCRKAKETPDAANNFRRKHCNQETESNNPWLSVDEGSAWAKCGGGNFYGPHGLTQEAIERFRGCDCWVGGDLSSISDLTALGFAFPDGAGGVDTIVKCWCPRENAVGRQRDKQVPYLSWAQQGLIELTAGNSVDYDCLRGFLRTARDDWGWNIRQVAFDPNNARYLMTKIVEEDGFAADQVIELLQTTAGMNEPIGILEKLILDNKLRHGGHKVLRWCASNVVTYKDTGGRRRFNKKTIREKIDLLVATTMAVGRAMIGNGDERSVYEVRGLWEPEEAAKEAAAELAAAAKPEPVVMSAEDAYLMRKLSEAW